jgi:hypothetical protein
VFHVVKKILQKTCFPPHGIEQVIASVRKTCRKNAETNNSRALARLFRNAGEGVMRLMPVVQAITTRRRNVRHDSILRGEIDFTLNDNPNGFVHSFAIIEDLRARPGLTLCDPR